MLRKRTKDFLRFIKYRGMIYRLVINKINKRLFCKTIYGDKKALTAIDNIVKMLEERIRYNGEKRIPTIDIVDEIVRSRDLKFDEANALYEAIIEFDTEKGYI